MITANSIRLFLTFLMLPVLSCPATRAQELSSSASNSASASKSASTIDAGAEKLELAKEACRLGGIDRELREIADKQLKLVVFAEQLSSSVTSKDENEFRRRERIAIALKEVLEKDVDLVSEIKTLMIAAFAREFSADELKQMIAFYKTETGKKLVEQTPKMADVIIKRTMTDVVPKLNQAMQAAVNEVVLDKKKTVNQ
ncbi:DUF2059 domain-containing protein [bacterium]|nr:DUF2059 domain-containing protein [bacterium]